MRKSPHGLHLLRPGFFTMCSGDTHGLPILWLTIPARSIALNSYSAAVRFFPKGRARISCLDYVLDSMLRL